MNKLTNILEDPFPFLDHIFNKLKLVGIDVSSFELDHICYRVESEVAYFEKKTALFSIAKLLVANDINGREISSFKLFDPIVYENRSISVLELPSPKIGSLYSKGFEHVEFVTKESLDEFQNQYAHLIFDKKGMKKQLNRDLRIKFENTSVKFHEMSLEKVIEIELQY